MAQIVADRRDIDFVLHEQLDVENLCKYGKFAEFNRKTVDMIVSEARNLAIKEMLPALKIADEEGCKFDKGIVKVPEPFHRIYQLFREGEWIAMCDDPEWGGQGMPSTVSLAVKNYFHGANFPFVLNILLSHGAGKLIERFGTDKQKKLFLKKMYSGEWGGSMLLTEPEAGSDVGALTTTAVKNEDGTYSISGSKIFISSGEGDLTKNIIHPVLARIEGSPVGTAGISLFLVPKIWVNDDGTLGEPNDIVCTGIEEKMGIHGSPTCSITLGGKSTTQGGGYQCRGTLLGQENRGMRAMFVMMNEARLDVGMQALGCASASFLNALNYARERVQGKHLLHNIKSSSADKNSGDSRLCVSNVKESAGVPIIQHPDIRRMLLNMKVYTEGCRSLLFYIGMCEDRLRIIDDAAKVDNSKNSNLNNKNSDVDNISDQNGQKRYYQGMIDFLTPIGKGYVTDKAFEVCSLGIQVYGGYGYTKEYPQEQYLRDCRITQIYEGTNGIQAMDLLGRKLGLNNGEAFNNFVSEIKKIIKTAEEISELAELAQKTDSVIKKFEQTANHILNMTKTDTKSNQIMTAYSHAYSFMEVTGDLTMAWMLLWRAVAAAKNLDNINSSKVSSKKQDESFYKGQIANAQFFVTNYLPITLGKMDVILQSDSVAVDITDEMFGGR
ncbi:MAG: acyl-CoA dehydrogenase [Desulfamplus sp.]|nr:acyl-CoA dehydrogenase [Desulfamplus sp.]